MIIAVYIRSEDTPEEFSYPRKHDSPDNIATSLVQSFEAATEPAFMSSMYLIFAAVKYLAALRPETRPKTTQSNKELPPKRLFPWTPPIASPAAYNPPIMESSTLWISASAFILRPPMQ